MVPLLMGQSIWKNWETGVLVCLVFSVFSKELLTSHCENTESESLDPSIDFLHDFTLFVIDMHQKRSISLFPTPFGHFHFHPYPALIWWVDLRPCHIWRKHLQLAWRLLSFFLGLAINLLLKSSEKLRCCPNSIRIIFQFCILFSFGCFKEGVWEFSSSTDWQSLMDLPK